MRENALTAAKTVRWAASAEVRDVATGALENVALCDAPSAIRLNSARAMRELRERQSRSGVGFCVKTLEAAEEAETEGKLSQAEGLLDRVVEELRVAFQTDGYKERSASYAAAVKKPARDEDDDDEDVDEAEHAPVEVILMAHARLFLARMCFEQGKRVKGTKNLRIGEKYAAAAGRAPPKIGEDERVGRQRPRRGESAEDLEDEDERGRNDVDTTRTTRTAWRNATRGSGGRDATREGAGEEVRRWKMRRNRLATPVTGEHERREPVPPRTHQRDGRET